MVVGSKYTVDTEPSAYLVCDLILEVIYADVLAILVSRAGSLIGLAGRFRDGADGGGGGGGHITLAAFAADCLFALSAFAVDCLVALSAFRSSLFGPFGCFCSTFRLVFLLRSTLCK